MSSASSGCVVRFTLALSIQQPSAGRMHVIRFVPGSGIFLLTTMFRPTSGFKSNIRIFPGWLATGSQTWSFHCSYSYSAKLNFSSCKQTHILI